MCLDGHSLHVVRCFFTRLCHHAPKVSLMYNNGPAHAQRACTLPAAVQSLALVSELPVARWAASSGKPRPAPGCHATPAMLCRLGPQQHAVIMQCLTEHAVLCRAVR